MSNKTIPALPASATLTGSEQLELAQSGNSVNTTISALLAVKTPNPTIQVANYDANAYDQILADTTSTSFTITLPASPSFGQTIWFVDAAGTWAINNLLVVGNGTNILGTTDTFIANADRDNFSLIYYNSSQGWTLGN